ncbi:MAG TPA: hypothetical protein DCY97_02675, partial [Marinilabiliales bacterium]|nr:hypothetical protein [Marinilabiliales bacterium]
MGKLSFISGLRKPFFNIVTHFDMPAIATKSGNALLAFLMEQEEIEKLKMGMATIQADVETKLTTKADKSDTFTRLEVDTKLDSRLSETEKTNLLAGKLPNGNSISLDMLADGVDFKRVKASVVNASGQIDFISADIVNRTLDNLPDGSQYRKVKAGAVDSSGQIDLSSTLVVNKTLDNIAETSSKKYLTDTEKTNLNTGKKPDGTAISLDSLSDGTTYRRVKAGAVDSSGQIDLSSTLVVNKTLDNIAETTAKKYLTATEKTNFSDGKKADGTYITADQVGAVSQKTAGTQLLINDWEIGSGSTGFYTINGATSENYRVYGLNPKDERAILWECRPDAVSDADGGWLTDSFAIDKTKSYRFSVFAKTNANSGTTYLGCKANSVCNLNTATKNSNPYFWSGDLPENNKWYLIVGYIFPAGETGLITQGGIYDCLTGRKVSGVSASFNWASDALDSIHRCYHYYDTNTGTRQWMYNPRVDLIDGNEPSITALLGKIAAEDIKYLNDKTLEELRPAAANADVTGQNTALDTQKVNGVLASTVYHTGNKPTAADVGATTSSDVTTIADGRIATKIGSDTVIGYLKAGKKSDGNYITATNVGARANTWTPIAADL